MSEQKGLLEKALRINTSRRERLQDWDEREQGLYCGISEGFRDFSRKLILRCTFRAILRLLCMYPML